MSDTPGGPAEAACAAARGGPTFHTVTEAAELLRVDPVTIYRAIRANAFPAVKIRGRYVVPAQALERLARDAVDSLACVDAVEYVLQRRAHEPVGRSWSG